MLFPEAYTQDKDGRPVLILKVGRDYHLILKDDKLVLYDILSE